MRNRKLKLVLASRSPRRYDILRTAGYQCARVSSNSSESFSENLNLDENLCAVAEDKIDRVLDKLSPRKRKGILVLSADTIVVVDKIVFGKPENRSEARRMLGRLSGRTHLVKTAFSLYCPDEGRGVTRIVESKVGFRKLSLPEIESYLDSGEPFDKAGSYAMQGLGSKFINFLDGDLLNVVGLPLTYVEQELKRQHWLIDHGKTSRGSKKNKRR